MHKYYIDKIREAEKWELEIVETGEVIVFDILRDAINYVKKDKGKFSVLDYWDEGIAYFENGKVYRVESNNDDVDYMKEHYQGIQPKDSYEVACSSCGDGGCILCRPNWFI